MRKSSGLLVRPRLLGAAGRKGKAVAAKAVATALSCALALSFLPGMTAGAEAVFSVPFTVSASAAVLIEAGTGKIVYAKNQNEKRAMASTTKIMTTLLTLESGDLDEEFTVDPDAIKVEGSSMGLQEGDIVTKRALCYGMMLPSGNDAANSAAIRVGGSFEKFAQMMNERAAKIKMTNTHFVTPSGLDDDAHYSTAYDMALLAREALRNEDFAEICSTGNAKLRFGNPPYDRWLKNSNKLLQYYDGCIGVKTGFTDKAGRCLVSAAERDGVRLIAVTLNAPDDWNDHKKMFDYGFSTVKAVTLDIPQDHLQMRVAGGEKDSIPLLPLNMPVACVTPQQEGEITYRYLLPRFAFAPVQAGTVMGEIAYILDGEVIETVTLVAGEDAGAAPVQAKVGLWEQICAFFGRIAKWLRLA